MLLELLNYISIDFSTLQLIEYSEIDDIFMFLYDSGLIGWQNKEASMTMTKQN